MRDGRVVRVAVAAVAVGCAMVAMPTGASGTDGDAVTTILDADPNYLDSIAAAPDGSVFVTVRSAGIWRLAPDGTVSHFAGTPWSGSGQSPAADGAPAREVPMNAGLLAVAPDGALWVAGEGRLRRIANGVSHEIAGDGWHVDPETGRNTVIGSIIALAAVDSTHVVAAGYTGEVHIINIDGQITQIADLATELKDVAVGPGGAVYALTFHQVIRVDQTPAVVAGAPPTSGGFGGADDGAFATDAHLRGVRLTVEPDGDLLLISEGRVRRVHMDESNPTIGTVTGVRLREFREGTVATARYQAPGDFALRGNDLVIVDEFLVREIPGVVTRPDLPPQPAEPPTIDVTTDPPGLAEEQPWGPLGEGHEPPVQLTITATSPAGTAMRRAWISELTGYGTLADVQGSTATVVLRRPGVHELAVGAYDDYGNLFVKHVRVNLTIPREACPPEVPEDGFVDVPDSNVHETAIDCAVYRGLVTGVGGAYYGPARTMTRAQAATIIAQSLDIIGFRLAAGADAFTDDNGSVHEPNINRLAAAGLIGGVAPGRFDPVGTISRAQLASLITAAYERAAGQSLSEAPDRFVDDNGSVHERRINQAANAGLVTGVNSAEFAPSLDLRRDQMGSLATRFAILGLDRN